VTSEIEIFLNISKLITYLAYTSMTKIAVRASHVFHFFLA
jgi:hypothetical protein